MGNDRHVLRGRRLLLGNDRHVLKRSAATYGKWSPCFEEVGGHLWEMTAMFCFVLMFDAYGESALASGLSAESSSAPLLLGFLS